MTIQRVTRAVGLRHWCPKARAWFSTAVVRLNTALHCQQTTVVVFFLQDFLFLFGVFLVFFNILNGF